MYVVVMSGTAILYLCAIILLSYYHVLYLYVHYFVSPCMRRFITIQISVLGYMLHIFISMLCVSL